MVLVLTLGPSWAGAQIAAEPAQTPPAPSKIRSADDGGVGFRYEIARKYGIHMGLDIAFAPENTAVYVQVGSAWSRP